jgi:HEPN domain-containing protein
MERYKSWIERAKSSLELAQVKIIRHICYEDLCFQLQQAAEKALKGLLIYYNFDPEFTHNIEILLNDLKKFTEIPENIKEASRLTNYAVQTRYPGEYDEITKEEYEESVKIAAACLNWVENKINGTEENEPPRPKGRDIV